MTAKKLSPSQEDYLEAILQITRRKKAARSRDIAALLKVTRPSVTGALRALAEKKLVHYEPYDFVTLTTKGNAAAKNVADRHAILVDFLTAVLGMEQNSAEQHACGLEHALLPEVARRLSMLMKVFRACPRGTQWQLERFRDFCSGKKDGEACESCVAAKQR